MIKKSTPLSHKLRGFCVTLQASGVGLLVCSVAVRNASKHGGALVGAELWVASASAVLMERGDAVSSEGPVLRVAQAPEQRAPAAFSRTWCRGRAPAWFSPERRRAEQRRGLSCGSEGVPGVYSVL